MKYLFIDGGALRETIKRTSAEYFDGVEMEIDYSRLIAGYTKAFYYDAMPVLDETAKAIDSTKAEVQKAFLSKLRKVSGLHVYEGDARRQDRRGLEQKKVDVMIAVDMLTHSFRGNMQRGTLLTGDLDFKPLIDALVQDGLFVTVLYPPGRTSDELLAAADFSQPLDINMMHGFCTEQFQKAHPIPWQGNDLSVAYLDNQRIAQWNDDLKGAMQLFAFDGVYCLVFPQVGTHFLHVRHTDLAMLRKFARSAHGVEIPEISIEDIAKTPLEPLG